MYQWRHEVLGLYNYLPMRLVDQCWSFSHQQPVIRARSGWTLVWVSTCIIAISSAFVLECWIMNTLAVLFGILAVVAVSQALDVTQCAGSKFCCMLLCCLDYFLFFGAVYFRFGCMKVFFYWLSLSMRWFRLAVSLGEIGTVCCW